MRSLPAPSSRFALAAFLPLIIILLIVSAVVWFMGTTNKETPAGYVGYVTQGSIFGKSRFIGVQTGPTSTGRLWLGDVVNVSVTPYTTSEEFVAERAVLSRDNLSLQFAVHIVWRVRPDRVKEFIEQYSAVLDNTKPDDVVESAYHNFLREQLRTYARDEIQKYDGLQIKDNISQIGQTIQQRVLKLTENTPFEVTSVVVGNMQYPKQVSDSVAQKLAATQLLEQKRTEVLIAEQDKLKRITEASGQAEAMALIQQKLNGDYLQYLAIESQKALANSQNNTVIYIPVGPMGVPIVQGAAGAAGPMLPGTPRR